MWTWLVVVAVIVVAGVVAALLLVPWARRVLTRGPDGQIALGLLWHAIRLYCRIVHRVRYEGLEHVPPTNRAGPLIVVANHTGGVDPLLIQAACAFKIRWMTAAEFMKPRWFWKWVDMIPVARSGRDSRATREAIRYVRSGGVIGVFPEGGIAKPPGEIRPFMPGIGFLINKCRAPVLLVWVRGTPVAESAMGSLRRFSRARVTFAGTFEFEEDRDPEEITQALRVSLAEASGWPLNDEPLPSARGGGAARRDPFAA